MEQTLGKRISHNRKRIGLTQEQLAEKLGVTAQAVSKWENDQSCPDITTLPKLAEIFQTTTDEILGLTSTQPIHEAEIVTEPTKDAEPEGLHIRNDGFEFKLDNASRNDSIGIALLVLITGSLTFLATLLDWDVSFWNILWPTTLLVFGAFGVLPKFSFFRLGCLIFGGYFLLDNLNLLPFDFGWGLIFPLCLVLFGISLLVDALKKPKKRKAVRSNAQITYSTDEAFLNYVASFGRDHRVVNMPMLMEGTINTCFGEYTLDLSEVEEIAEGCNLGINCSFGEVTLLIPQHFRVQCECGTVQVHGQPQENTHSTILINANTSFANVEIRYI